jgi:hypothetical protein
MSALQTLEPLVKEKRWKEALDQVLPGLGRDAASHYNAGTLALLDGNPGLAKAYLEKAAHLAPRSTQIHQQLQLAREQVARIGGTSSVDAPVALPLEVGETLRGLRHFEAISLIVLITLSFFGIVFYRKVRSLRAWIRSPWVHLGLALAVPLWIALSLMLYAKSTPWVVFTEESALRSGPGERFLEMGRSVAGMRTPRTGTQSEGWVQVFFKPGTRAWVSASSVLLLD